MWDQMIKVKERETQDGLEGSLQLTGIPAGTFEVNARNSERIKHELTEEERNATVLAVNESRTRLLSLLNPA